MERDRLFILKTKFADGAFPGRDFYCTECMTVRALFTAFPEAAARLDVEEVGFSRPRASIATLIGAANQAAPVLVLADDAPADIPAREHEGRRFITDLSALLLTLHLRHGFPEPHP